MADNADCELAKPVAIQHTQSASDLMALNEQSSAKPLPKTSSLAAALAENGPPYDACKVVQLRAVIASGAYMIDLASVADAMRRFGGE